MLLSSHYLPIFRLQTHKLQKTKIKPNTIFSMCRRRYLHSAMMLIDQMASMVRERHQQSKPGNKIMDKPQQATFLMNRRNRSSNRSRKPQNRH